MKSLLKKNATVRALLGVALLAGTSAWAAVNRVTFTNTLSEEVEVVVRTGDAGEDASCDAKPRQSKIVLPAGGRQTVDGGGETVCFCWAPSSQGAIRSDRCKWDSAAEGEVRIGQD